MPYEKHTYKKFNGKGKTTLNREPLTMNQGRPEPNPTPSPTDISSIISNYNSALLAVPFLMMIIVGTGSLYCSVYNGNNFVVMSNIDNSI